VTLAEALREAGYATGHFGKWHVGSVTAGSVYSPGANGFDEWLSSPNFYENDPQFSHRGEVVRRKGESSAVTVEAALEFMRRCSEQQRPFLAVVWFGSPHRPHQATAELLAAYASEEQSMQHFYGELAGIDAAMGELRKGLRDLDLVDRTLLWYTSDNGGLHESSSPGLRGRKGDLDEGGLRVPCVLEWPGVVAAGQVSSCVSGTVDIFPTVLQLAQVELQPQPQLDGESLVDLLRGEDWRRSEPLGFWVVPADGRPMHSNRILEALQRGEALETSAPLQVPPWLAKGELPGSAAWLSGDLKLHRRWSEDGAVHDELYDLSSDPGEQQDRSAERPALLNTLRQELQVWQQSVLASLRQHLAAEGS
jgi:arylsulfatase A-like enzyme